MNKLIKMQWQTWAKKYAAISPRERWMLMLATLASLYFVMNTIWLAPLMKQHQKWHSDNVANQLISQQLQQQLKVANAQNAFDVDAENKKILEGIQNDIVSMKALVLDAQANMMTPEKIPMLLRDLLKQHGDIKLIALKSLPATRLSTKVEAHDLQPVAQANTADPVSANLADIPTSNTQKNKPENKIVVYEHSVEMTLEGRYFDLLSYVKAVEHLHKNLLWDKAELSVKEYPISQLKLTVGTLGLDDIWLEI